MWIRLDGASIADAHIEKLNEALRKNTVILSLDLSCNQLTDSGVQLLVEELGNGAAPDLIELNLKQNPGLTETGISALQSLTDQGRKMLQVDYGYSPAMKESTLADDLRNSVVVRKYFQIDDNDDDDKTGDQGEQQEEEEIEPRRASVLLWDDVLSALDANAPHIPALSVPLRAIVDQIDAEMSECALPMLKDTQLSDLKPFTGQALDHLATLEQILDIQPVPLVTTYSRTVALPGIGTHRANIAELLAQLLRAECPCVFEVVRRSGLVKACVKLAIEFPNASAVQCSVLKSLHFIVSPACGDMCLWRSILPDVVQFCLACEVVDDIGRRRPNVGFMLAIAELLQSTATGIADIAEPEPAEEEDTRSLEEWQVQLKTALEAIEGWTDFSNNALVELIGEQRGDIAGPKPEKRILGADLGSYGSGGQVISGQDLLAMLRGLHVGAGGGSGY